MAENEFTKRDRERLTRIETLMEVMNKTIDPLVAMPARLSVVETNTASLLITRKRAITAVVAVFVAVTGGLLLWGLKGLLAGAMVAGAAGAMIP